MCVGVLATDSRFPLPADEGLVPEFAGAGQTAGEEQQHCETGTPCCRCHDWHMGVYVVLAVTGGVY
jgi:hypothetical protein